jgi:hypothetical protein
VAGGSGPNPIVNLVLVQATRDVAPRCVWVPGAVSKSGHEHRPTCTIALALFTLFLTVILVGIPTVILAVPVLGNSSGRLEFTPPGSVNRSCSGAPQGPRLAKMQLLFEPTTIPSHCHAQLESDLLVGTRLRLFPEMTAEILQLRPLAADDDARGHLELLSVLTVAPNLSGGKYRGKSEDGASFWR